MGFHSRDNRLLHHSFNDDELRSTAGSYFANSEDDENWKTDLLKMKSKHNSSFDDVFSTNSKLSSIQNLNFSSFDSETHKNQRPGPCNECACCKVYAKQVNEIKRLLKIFETLLKFTPDICRWFERLKYTHEKTQSTNCKNEKENRNKMVFSTSKPSSIDSASNSVFMQNDDVGRIDKSVIPEIKIEEDF